MRITLKRTLMILLFISNEAYSIEDSILKRINDFEIKISNAEKASEKISIKKLVEEGESISESLIKVVPDLPESIYAEIKMKMKGHIINREEFIFVGLDNDYFLSLSDKKGDREDKLYFQFMKKYKPNSIVPAYIDQQTDYSGCINYQSKKLSQLYIEGTNIMNDISGIYQHNVIYALSDMSEVIENGNCACSDKNSVVSELELIAKASDGSVAGEFFRKRLDSVKNDTANVTFHCKAQ